MKEIPLYKNQGNSTIEDEHINLVSSEIPKVASRNNKKTISYSQQKSYDIGDDKMKVTNPAFRERQKKFSLHTMGEPKSERRS